MAKSICLLGIFVVLLATPAWAVRYVDNGNGTVTDTQTKLVWQQPDDGTTKSWEEAITYCENLDLGSRVDWRLPNFRALQSLVDDTRVNPAMDPIFVGARWDLAAGYWSSTTFFGTGATATTDLARAVEFANGNSSQDAKVNNYFYVRCVSGGL